MDNQTHNNTLSKFLTKRNIFIILGVVILGELIWAGKALLKPNALVHSPAPAVSVPEVKEPTVIKLTSKVRQVKVGDKVAVLVNITSPKNTQGADIIIKFDPKILRAETIGETKEPVVLSGMYSEYPVNKLDLITGKITVSGISSATGGVLTNGLFGTVTFIAKAAGVSKISLDFTPGSTTDSNIIQSGDGRDALDSVENLEVNISP